MKNLKRTTMAKGGSILVGLALSLSANAMDQQVQGKAGVKIAPKDVVNVHAPEGQHLGDREEQKIEHEKLTVKEIVTTKKTREHDKWETMEMVYNDLGPVEVCEQVTTWTKERRKPCEKAVKTTIVKQEVPCAQQAPVVKAAPKSDCALDTQCQAPAVAAPVPQKGDCAQAPVAVKSDCAQAPVAKVAKVAKAVPMCDQVSQIVPSNCGPCTDILGRDGLQRVSTLNWFHHHGHAKNFLVEQKAFGHAWSFGERRTINWDKTNFSCGIFDNFAARGIDAHKSNWSNIQFLGGDSELLDVEWKHANLRDITFRGERHNRLKLSSVKFNGSRLTNVVFENVKFDHSGKKHWRKTSFKNTILENVIFINVDFDHVTFDGAIFLPGAQFNQCASNMDWQKFVGARIWMGEGQRYNVVTLQSVQGLQKNCQSGFGYDQLKQYSQASQY